MSPRILVCSLQVGAGSSKGHLNPLVGLVQWLVKRGAHVGWLALPSALGPHDRTQVEALGVELIETPPLPAGVILPGEELSRRALDPARVWEVYRSFLIDPLPHLLEPVRAVVRAFRPDAAACDGMCYSGLLACQTTGVPWAGIGAGFKILKEGGFAGAYMGDFSRLVEPRARAFAAAGVDLDFRLFECVSPHANVVFLTRALAGDLPLPPRTHLVGPSVAPAARGDESAFPFEALPARPLVLTGFGSVHTHLADRALFDAIGRGARAAGAALVVASQALANDRVPDGWPPDTLVRAYVPQLALLDRASAFVTHGGANSVMEGLARGVPLLVIPLSSDQPWQAELVRRAGAGEALERAAATPARVAAALARLLDPDGPARRGAARIAESCRGADGARAAADLVLSLSKKEIR